MAGRGIHHGNARGVLANDGVGETMPFVLKAGYPTFSFARDSLTATEVIIINSTDVARLYRISFPYPQNIKGNKLGVFRPRPFIGVPNLRTKTVSVKPLTSDLPGDPLLRDFNSLGYADWLKTYEELYEATIEYELYDADDYEHSMTVGGQFLSSPSARSNLQDVDTINATAAVNVSETVVEPNRDVLITELRPRITIEHRVRWPVIVGPDFEAINLKLGQLNSDNPDFLNKPAKWTVMFMGYSGKRLDWWDGIADDLLKVYDLTFHFSQMQTVADGLKYGFNHVYSPSEGKWKLLRKVGNSNKPMFDAFNFKAAFQNYPGIS